MQPHQTNPRRGELVFAASFTGPGRQVVELWNDGEGPFTLKLVDFSARKPQKWRWKSWIFLPYMRNHRTIYIYILYGCSDILYMIYIDYFSVFFHPRWAFWVWIASCFHLFESDPDLSTAMGYHHWQSKYGSKLGPKMHGLNHTNISGSITVSFKVWSMPKCRSI
jgi:hypothetical protein